MRTPTTFDPRYLTHVRPVLDGFMLAHATVSEPTGEHPKWEPGVGTLDNAWRTVWAGPVRVQPNIDWRARARDNTGEWDATMAVRVSVPIAKNEHGAVRDTNGDILTYSPDPVFSLGHVLLIDSVNYEWMQDWLTRRLTVRNAMTNTQAWEYDLLCDAGTSRHG